MSETAYYAVKVPLDPTPAQERAFNSHAGGARFAYNAGLAHIKEQLEERKRQQEADVDKKDLIKIDNTVIKLGYWWRANRDRIAPWYVQNASGVYNCAFDNLAKASRNFLKSLTGQRKGPKVAFPKFKKRGSVKAFAFPAGVNIVDDHGVHLPRIGRVHTLRNVRKLVAGRTIKTSTVRHEGGRWYISLLCETPTADPTPWPMRTIGVDLGIKELAVLSDGTIFRSPHPLRDAQKQLAHAQRALSRKTKGSARYMEQKRKVNRIHARVRFLRANAIHELTSYLTANYTDICIEDLNVQGMTRNHRLAQAVNDAAFAEIRRQLEYKAVKNGARIHVIDRFYPSSKTCSACGHIKTDLTLADRMYECEACGLRMDRDLNAAKNIEREGMRDTMISCS